MSSSTQATLDEFETMLSQADPQCEAIAVSTEERCERHAVDGVPYCPLHLSNIDPGDPR